MAHHENRCACRAILRMAFGEISKQGSSIKASVKTDFGPLDGSPASLAGPVLELSRNTKIFYITKIRFPYEHCPAEIKQLVVDLENAFVDLEGIAKSIDSVEKRRRT